MTIISWETWSRAASRQNFYSGIIKGAKGPVTFNYLGHSQVLAPSLNPLSVGEAHQLQHHT
jgi:hypothetical protein